MVRELCQLEKSFTRLMGIAFAKYPLRHFIRWASMEPADSAASLSVGPVMSAHLFRGKRGIEHEFVLVSFGDPKSHNPTSWLRAERTARAKTSSLHPQWDMAGPLFSGVPPLDTISFSTSKSHLVSSYDVELASLTIVGDSPLLSGIYIRELSHHFAATVNASPEYKLWSTNCRFFARRTLINLAVRLALSQMAQVHHVWSSKGNLELQEFLSKLQAERFGGSALIGLPATIGRVKTLLYMADVDSQNHLDAINAMNEALGILDSLPAVDGDTPINLIWLRSDCMAAKARALYNLGLYEECYVVSSQATDLVRPESNVHGTLLEMWLYRAKLISVV